MNAPAWEHFDHEADIGIRGFGRSPAEAFEQAALALTAIITEPTRVTPAREVRIEAENADPELLLVDWLNTLILEMAARVMLFSRFEVVLTGSRLSAGAWGEAVDLPRHQPAVEVKGASYGGLRVFRRPDGLWQAECIVDV
jgi:SHS2 domain-containing protein